jgi:hypothetical protein
MKMIDQLQEAIEALKRAAREQVDVLRASPEMVQLVKIHSALNTLEGLSGIAKTPLSSLFGLDAEAPVEQTRMLVSPGEFFGKAPLEAAKLYLRKKTKPATLTEIVENLATGSCEVRDREKLRVSLGRSTFEIARLGEDNFGLLDWYPDEKQKRLAAAKRRGTNDSQQSNGEPPAELVEGMNEPPGE